MTQDDFQQLAAIYADDEDIDELARMFFFTYEDGRKAGRNEMLEDERVKTVASKEAK